MKNLAFAIATTLAAWGPLATHAATVTLDGKLYETDQALSLTAELGKMDTTSVAIRIGRTYDSILAEHAALVASDPTAVPSRFYREENWNGFGPDFYVQDPGQTSFSISNTVSLTDDMWHYLGFDVTFAPTAETVAMDAMYSTTLTGDAVFGIGYDTEGADYINYSDVFGGNDDPTGTMLFFFDAIGTSYASDFTATVLPSSDVTPVPLPAGGLLLALGLVGIGVASRRTS